MRWLEEQGPWCPALLEYLQRSHQQYDVLIFFTYLYAPTVLGMQIAPRRASSCRPRTTNRRSISGSTASCSPPPTPSPSTPRARRPS